MRESSLQQPARIALAIHSVEPRERVPPVYKAIYSGALKAVVDLIPPDALEGRLGLGIATTRLGDHAATVESAYRSLFAFFRARPLDPLVLLDRELASGATGLALEETGRARADRTVQELLAAIAR